MEKNQENKQLNEKYSTLENENKQLNAAVSAQNDVIKKMQEQIESILQKVNSKSSDDSKSVVKLGRKRKKANSTNSDDAESPRIADLNESEYEMEIESENAAKTKQASNENLDTPTSSQHQNDKNATNVLNSLNGEQTSGHLTAEEWKHVSYKAKKNRQQKAQPIQLPGSGETKKVVYNLLNRKLKKNSFTISTSANNMKIFPCSAEVNTEIIKVLENNQFEFHTYINDTDKQKCYILKGLENFFSLKEIEDALQAAGLSNFKIALFQTGFQRANPSRKHKTMYKVIFDAVFDEKNLVNVNSILGIAITWEKIKKRTTTQCHNCQRFFHTAAGCHYKHRCVKCTEDHEPGKCSLNNDSTISVLQCVNCHGNHSANDIAKCSYYQEKIKPLVEGRNVKSNETAKFVNTSAAAATTTNALQTNTKKSSKPNGGSTYAAVLKSNKQTIDTTQTAANNQHDNLNMILKDFFQPFGEFIKVQSQMMNAMLNKLNNGS